MNRKIILFDFDGTLADSSPGIIRCLHETLVAFSIPDDEVEPTAFIGPPLAWSLPHYYGLDAERTEAVINHFQTLYAAGGKNETDLYEGIPETLDALYRRGYRLGVATSKPQIFARELLEHFGVEQYFSVISGAPLNEEGTKADRIRAALVVLGASSADAVMVGDRSHDVLGAHEVGVPTVGALWGYGSAAELRESGAVMLAETPAALLTIFA